MLIKAFHSLNGVFSAAGDTPRGAVSANPDATRKPSNLTVRAALKRKRLAASDNPKIGEKKPV